MAARSREPYHCAQCRTEARRPDRSETDRALRRSLSEAAYADLTLAGAASALLHPHWAHVMHWAKAGLALAGAASALLHPHWAHVMHWAKAGATNTVANATAAISVFIVSLHLTHLR